MVTFGEDRKALAFGSQKINLHQQGKEFEPKAHRPHAGIRGHLPDHFGCPAGSHGPPESLRRVELIDGPVKRTGAVGTLLSVYFRDPDLNLIEVSNYIRD